jgi:hypothetical protein
MSVETVRAVAAKFLTGPDLGVLVIKGEWGVGKTFVWNSIVEANKDAIVPPEYAYVSLFGVTSLNELRLTILAKSRKKELIGKKIDAKTASENIKDLAAPTAAKAVSLLNRFKGLLPQSAQVALGIDALASFFIRDMVICLDDFERMGGTITAEAFLGFVSELKEELGCKVVLIFNEEKLNERRDSYSAYREKVVDVELLYAPTPQEAVAIGMPGPELSNAAKHAIALGIRNIRILRKIARTLALIEPIIRGMHPKLTAQAAATTVLTTWSLYDRNPSTPPISFLRQWNGLAWSLTAEDKAADAQLDPQAAAENEKRKRWAQVLEDYGVFTSVDAFDLALMKVVERGYVEESGLSEAAADLDAQFKAGDLEQQFSDAWNIFHESFGDEEDKLIETLVDTFKKTARRITPLNLNGTVRLLRELGRQDKAEELIEFYMAERKDETALFDLSDYSFAGEITETSILDKFKAKVAEPTAKPSLLDSFERLVAGEGGKIERNVISAASADELFTLFKAGQNKNLHRWIRGALQFDPAVAARTKSALEKIASESELNRVRVSRYGIKPAAPAS